MCLREFRRILQLLDRANYQKPGNTHKTGNNAIKMSQAFQDIAHFECFMDPNLFKYAFNVIQNWKTNSLQIFRDGAYFLLAVIVEGDESSLLRMAD